MNPTRSLAFEHEIALAKEFIATDNFAKGIAHLQRAHIIGQTFVAPHAKAHWLMLKLEWRRERPMAVLGQIARLVLGIIGSAVGVVPVGNTGDSDIGMFKRMPLAPDLQRIIDGDAPLDVQT